MSTDYSRNIIVLRSVYGKVGMKYYMQPCKDKYGRLPNCVKRVNALGDMILSDAERNSEESQYYIPETAVFEFEDGKTFDLEDPLQKNIWESIKNNTMIAPNRFAKDKDGNFLIDGTANKNSHKQRYGIAELYVDMPGIETANRVSRKKKIHNACDFIYNDPRGSEGLILKARLLGKRMQNMPIADVEDYLLKVAEKDPDKIIDLYTGTDTNLRLLFVDALDKHIIIIKNKLYMYSDNVVLGATDDAVITWMKQSANKKVLELIRRDTYPEMYKKEEIDDSLLDGEPTSNDTKVVDPVVENAIKLNAVTGKRK